MDMKDRINDEVMNAYIDGELDANDVLWVANTINNVPKLKSRFNELEATRNLYFNAFDCASEPIQSKTVTYQPRRTVQQIIGATLAASLLVALGFVAGIYLPADNTVTSHSSQVSNFITMNELAELTTLNSPDIRGYKALVHMQKFDNASALHSFKYISAILERARANEINIQIEIIAQGPGLDILRSDTSPVAEEIGHLMMHHNNIVFAACNKAIQRLKLEKGMEANLLPGVTIVPSALDQILSRMQSDWLYVRT